MTHGAYFILTMYPQALILPGNYIYAGISIVNAKCTCSVTLALNSSTLTTDPQCTRTPCLPCTFPRSYFLFIALTAARADPAV